METPPLGLPTVNIGLRQQGRERARNIVDAAPIADAILAATARALDPAFRKSLSGMESPYGDGRAGERIADVLASVRLGQDLLYKRATTVGR
jgi:UDP-N-acetylglucosamine 2-epimerase